MLDKLCPTVDVETKEFSLQGGGVGGSNCLFQIKSQIMCDVPSGFGS